MDYSTVTGTIKKETEAAILIEQKGDAPVWLPKSQLRSLRRDPDGFCRLEVPDWLCDEKNLQST